MQTRVPCSCYTRVGGLVYFARMLDKIRLHAASALPKDYHENLGGGFDERCCKFLNVGYDAVRAKTLAGGTDDEIFTWCCTQGRRPAADEIEIWNSFMTKRGWRDEAVTRLRMRLKEANLEKRAAEILTLFDFLEVDEGREPPKFS